MDPIFNKHPPETLWSWIGSQQPRIEARGLDIIGQRIDFSGINDCKTQEVSFAIDEPPLKARVEPVSAPGLGLNAMGWGSDPSGLKAGLLNVMETYGHPAIYIGGNGCPFHRQAG